VHMLWESEGIIGILTPPVQRLRQLELVAIFSGLTLNFCPSVSHPFIVSSINSKKEVLCL